MKQIRLFLLFILLTQTLYAQKTSNEYAGIDKKALQLPESLTRSTTDIASYVTSNFRSDDEKVRAIFIWITTNIRYDIDNMYALNFYEKNEDKIARALKTRKGICVNYAALFNEICTKAGIRSYVISGYTKQNGVTDYLPHAWCAALVDTTWYMFDPTWGSGYVSNGKFVKSINNKYFKAAPGTLIKSHMPFDYLWQFLNYPVTNQEFYEGKTQPNKSKPYFGYKDSIAAYDELSYQQQLAASAVRIEKNGTRNSLVFDRLQDIKLEIERERQNAAVNLYNSATLDFNASVSAYNEFINYRNKQFTPIKPDTEIQSMIDEADAKLKAASRKLSEIKNPDENVSALSSQLTKSISEADEHIKEQQDWLKTYFRKGKSGRRSMFYQTKVTWFGVPLN